MLELWARCALTTRCLRESRRVAAVCFCASGFTIFSFFRYSKVNGVPSCASSELLRSKLRDEWGFRTWAHWLLNAIACYTPVEPCLLQSSVMPRWHDCHRLRLHRSALVLVISRCQLARQFLDSHLFQSRIGGHVFFTTVSRHTGREHRSRASGWDRRGLQPRHLKQPCDFSGFRLSAMCRLLPRVRQRIHGAASDGGSQERTSGSFHPRRVTWREEQADSIFLPGSGRLCTKLGLTHRLLTFPTAGRRHLYLCLDTTANLQQRLRIVRDCGLQASTGHVELAWLGSK